jgi:hypothetical protein
VSELLSSIARSKVDRRNAATAQLEKATTQLDGGDYQSALNT